MNNMNNTAKFIYESSNRVPEPGLLRDKLANWARRNSVSATIGVSLHRVRVVSLGGGTLEHGADSIDVVVDQHLRHYGGCKPARKRRGWGARLTWGICALLVTALIAAAVLITSSRMSTLNATLKELKRDVELLKDEEADTDWRLYLHRNHEH